MSIENRLFRGLVIPTIILWSTVVVLPCVVCWLIGEQHGFQATFLIGTIGFIYLMCLGIIISTGIYLSVAICSYIKYRSIFIQCCGGDLHLWCIIRVSMHTCSNSWFDRAYNIAIMYSYHSLFSIMG